ncbi:MAG: radical SAM protein [Thermoplasmatota archaeon]
MKEVLGALFSSLSRPEGIRKDLLTLLKYAKVKAGQKVFFYGSCDITNRCNLNCKHCYWRKNFVEEEELSTEQFEHVIEENFIKNNIIEVALTGGEPLLRPEIIELFDEKGVSFDIVTNGTLPLKDFGQSEYYISIDGNEEIHDKIRGEGTYSRIKRNVENFSGDSNITINYTINSLNYQYIEEFFKEWKDRVDMINFQFHTPFSNDDELWIPYGKKRNDIIKKIKDLKRRYPYKSYNTDKQLDLLGTNYWTKNCPNWTILSLDHKGERKTPCCIGCSGFGTKPICEKCGMCEYAGIFSGLFQGDREWFEVRKRLEK